MTGSDGNINGPYFFYTSFNFSADIHGAQAPLQLNFISVFKDGNTCVGEVHVAKCTLVPAIVEQHVILVNKTLSLDPAYDYSSDKLIQYITSTSQGVIETHGGMHLFLSTRYNSHVETRFDGVYGLEIFHQAGSSQLE